MNGHQGRFRPPWLAPEASHIERLRVAAAAIAGLLLGGLTVDAPLAVALALALLTAELSAGLIADLNPSGKHRRHRPGRGAGALFGFAALHLVHLGLFTWLLRASDPQHFILSALFLLGGSTAVILAPARLQRAFALVATLAALLALDQMIGTVREGAWFMPLLFARVLIAGLPAPEDSD
jgi:hypothetical protein